MTSLASRLALAAGLLALGAPAALAQTTITVNRSGGTLMNTRVTVELRDAGGAPTGKAMIDHPGMGVRAIGGYIPQPQPQLAALEAAVQAADLLNQPGDEWTGANPDVATETFTDQDGDYSILHPMRGPNGIDVTPEMTALSQAMADAQGAFVAGSPPVALPFFTYTYAGGWVGILTLDVLSDGSCHLSGSGPKFDGIDARGKLSARQLSGLKSYMKNHAADWAALPAMFGKFFPDGTHEDIAYTDPSGVQKSVERWGTARTKPVWSYLDRWFKDECRKLDPTVQLP